MRPERRLVSWSGLGAPATPPGFDSLLSGVGAPAQQAWQQVETQLNAESGGSPVQGVLYNAQQQFLNAYDGLSQAYPALTANLGDIANLCNAAGNLSLQNNTILGQSSLIDGLIQGAVSGNTQAVVSAINGASMSALAAGVAAGIAAGALSCGAGAAIMVGIELADQFIQSLLSGTPPAATVCNAQLSQKPGIVVGCAFSFGQPANPGKNVSGGEAPGANPYWRSFPEPTNGNDAWWFTLPGGQGQGGFGLNSTYAPLATWTSNSSSDLWGVGAPGRPIDVAFPQYHQLECDMNAAIAVASLPDSGGTVQNGISAGTYSSDDVMFARFILAFFAAWKANGEFYLNGWSPRYTNDGGVLQSAITYWNNSHLPGAGRQLTARTGNPIAPNQPCAGSFSNEWWYAQMLVQQLGNTSITVNTGSKINVPSTLASTPASGPVSGGAAASSGGSGLLIAGGLLAAGAGGVYLYGRKHGMTFGQTLRSGWDHVRHPRRYSRR